MIKLFYVVGDSFVFGQEMGPPISPHNLHTFDFYKRRHCYSGIMSDTLKIENYMNSGSPAASNERSYRMLITDISKKLLTFKPEEIFVNVSLTSSTRREFCINDRGDYYLHMFTWEPPAKDNKCVNDLWNILSKDFNFDIGHETYDIMMVLAIQNFLRINKIPYLISSALCTPIKFELQKKYVPSILLDQIYSRRYYTKPSFTEFTSDNKYKRGPGGHPLEEAHAGWAAHLLNHINQNNLFDNSDL